MSISIMVLRLISVLSVTFYVGHCIPPPVPSDLRDITAVVQPVNNYSPVLERLLRANYKTQWVNQAGVHRSDPGGYRIRVDATNYVSDHALHVGATTIFRMVQHMPASIFHRLASQATVGIFTARETLCTYPEYYRFINPDFCGPSCTGSCSTSCTSDQRKYCSLAGAGGARTVILDDNILCNSADPYHGKANILVHEFAHTVMIHALDASTKSQIQNAFNAARAAGTWKDVYAMSTVDEYFAVSTSVFFNADHRIDGASRPLMTMCGTSVCNSEPSGKYHLYSIDPTLYNIVAGVFDPVNPNRIFNIGPCTSA